jgi:hypothetical protein
VALANPGGGRARAEDQGARLVAANALMLEFEILNHLGKTDDALAAVLRARPIFEAAADQDGVAMTVTAEAALREGKGDTAFVQKAQDQVAGIATELSNPKELMRFKWVIAEQLSEKGDLEGTMRALCDVREIARAQNDTAIESRVVIQLALIDMERGDLPAARDLLEGALGRADFDDEARATLLTADASIKHTQGDRAGAQASLERAAALAKPGLSSAEVQLTRAMIANDEENFKESEKIARAAASGSTAMAPFAKIILARSLVGQGRYADASAAIKEIGRSPFLRSPAYEFMIACVEGRVKAPTALADARKDLMGTLDRATTLGFVGSTLELRLALGEIEAAHGDAAKGGTLLAAVAVDARRAGFNMIAQRAQRLSLTGR